MKKLLAIVISMAMIVAMMPMGVFATDEESTDFVPYLTKAPLHNNGGSDEGLYDIYEYSAKGDNDGATYEIEVAELKAHNNENNHDGK